MAPGKCIKIVQCCADDAVFSECLSLVFEQVHECFTLPAAVVQWLQHAAEPKDVRSIPATLEAFQIEAESKNTMFIF